MTILKTEAAQAADQQAVDERRVPIERTKELQPKATKAASAVLQAAQALDEAIVDYCQVNAEAEAINRDYFGRDYVNAGLPVQQRASLEEIRRKIGWVVVRGLSEPISSEFEERS